MIKRGLDLFDTVDVRETASRFLDLPPEWFVAVVLAADVLSWAYVFAKVIFG